LSGISFNGRDSACEPTSSFGFFRCLVPQHWTGTITPQRAGYTFTPSAFTATDVTQQNTERNIHINFEGRRQ
jgi:hypothetical protein